MDEYQILAHADSVENDVMLSWLADCLVLLVQVPVNA